MIHGTPEIMHLAVDLQIDLIKVPASMSYTLHSVFPLTADIPSEHRPEPVPPKPYCLMAKIDAALKQQVFDIAQRQREAEVHHHNKADHLARRVEAAKRAVGVLLSICGAFAPTTSAARAVLLWSDSAGSTLYVPFAPESTR